MKLSEKDVERILEATRAITSTLRLSETLATVMRLASEVARAEASALLLLDEATGELYFDVALGEKGGAMQQIRLKKGEGIAGWVAENRKPALVNDVANDPRWAQRADKKSTFKTRAILALPLMVREKLIGVMEVINRADGEHFNDVDQEILEAFAGQAAVAIANARLFESIRQEKEKMATILTEMSEGTLLLDAKGQIALTNAAAERLLGEAAKVGNPWPAFETIFDIRPSWEEVQRLHAAGGMEMTRKSAPPLQLSGVITEIRSDRGEIQGYLVIFRDVTEERREAQLKRNFLSLVSHKLKTPLVAIRGFTPLLLEKPEELTPFQKTGIETIDRNSQLLSSLVEKLVWFSTLEGDTLELTPKPYAPIAIVDAAITDLAAYLRTQPADIQRDASLSALPLVPLDKIWMQQAIRNLIENAVKFNSKPQRRVKIGGRRVGEDKVELFVTDDGIGIPPEEHAKIFQKFYQIEASFTGQVQGMGLGLALVKRVVEAHHGAVRVESAIDAGSTFTISLPTK